jgi:Putative Ig domain
MIAIPMGWPPRQRSVQNSLSHIQESAEIREIRGYHLPRKPPHPPATSETLSLTNDLVPQHFLPMKYLVNPRPIRVLATAAAAIVFGLTAFSAPAPEAPGQPEIRTPKAPAAPRINGPSIFGVRPGSPVLYRVPASGERPMEFSATGLPVGLQIDSRTGDISGSLAKPGEYRLTLRAKNVKGVQEKAFRLVVGDAIALTPPWVGTVRIAGGAK